MKKTFYFIYPTSSLLPITAHPLFHVLGRRLLNGQIDLQFSNILSFSGLPLAVVVHTVTDRSVIGEHICIIFEAAGAG